MLIFPEIFLCAANIALGLCCSCFGEPGPLVTGVQSSHCGASGCRAQALGAWAAVGAAHGLSCGSEALEHRLSSCGSEVLEHAGSVFVAQRC